MQTITGLFDSRPEAERTVEALVQRLGIPRDRVQAHAADTGNLTAGQGPADDQGFLASLRNMALPDEDRTTYEEGLRRGGVMVSVRTEEAQLDEVMDAFEEHGAIDLDTREREWRQAGWTGGSMAGVTAGTTIGTATAGLPAPDRGAVPGASSDGLRTGAGMAAGEEVIPLLQERLRVGKRQVVGGRLRIRSYTVETIAQVQVMLREEHVGIERRAVDRPVTEADRVDFRDRVIEATETTEEAVVGKQARVREEIVVRKQSGERTETVSDTVRHTEVAVEDGRTGTAARGEGIAVGITVDPTTGATPPDRNPAR